ncbi:MAG TPA: ABC transporter permease [Rhodanobacteraceae bacterium]|nr:ABC transporter permease [Rhodanobacteraceae bacterium]
METTAMLADLWNDVRYAARRITARPGFTVAVVLTLAVGIGANVLVSDLIDGVYFRALPYRDDAALVYIEDRNAKQGANEDNGMESIPDYLDRRRDVAALADSALYLTTDLNLLGTGAPERLRALKVTPSLFSTLGVGAVLGRTFTDDEATVGNDRVAVLSNALWRNRFNADPNVVGRDLRLSGETYRVVGVMPPSFLFPTADTEIFVPFAFGKDDITDDKRFTGFSQGIGRLAPGATPADVKDESDLIIRRNMQRLSASGADGAWYADIVESNGYTIKATPLREYFAGSRVRELPLIQVAVALVLLIVCANVANLMLVRWSARQKELAVRTVLGANRARIARQVLVEAMLLALVGGALGLGLALAGGQLVAASGLLPDWVSVGLTPSMLISAVALSLFAGALFGALPIFSRAGPQAQGALRESGRLASGGRGARMTRNTLVMVQLALAVALLASAGLLMRSFANILGQNPGFDSAGVLTATIALPETKYGDDAAQARVFRRMIDEVKSLPGVTAAGLTTTLPFSGTNAGQMFRIVGRASEGVNLHAALRRVDEGYFAAMGIPLLQGRTFARSDWNAGSHDVIVDALFAKKHFPNGDAVGSTLYLGSSGDSDVYTIVGVVGNVTHGNLAATASKETFYFDFGARPNPWGWLAVRTAGPTASLIEPIRNAIRSVDPDQPMFNVATLDQRVHQSLTGRRVPLELIGVFATLALVLAAIGIYGVLAFAVAERTGEFGVRMAIGANTAQIHRQVLGDGARIAGAGLGIGVVLALALGFALQSQLFGIGVVDPPSLAAVVAVLAATAFLACWLPARRAARTAPIEALRHE